MQGVEILNEVGMNGLMVGMAFLLAVCVVLSFVFITVTIFGFINWGGWDAVDSVFLTIGVGFGLIALFVYSNGSRNYWTEYEVTIEEDVKLLEFFEVYEIIDQDGNIFTVREVE